MATEVTKWRAANGREYTNKAEAEEADTIEFFVDTYGVYASGRTALRDALEEALSDGWQIVPPNSKERACRTTP